MSQYDLYGIGHALVDIEVSVDDAFLHTAGLQKGTMQLMDPTRQNALLRQLDPQTFHRSCGGSAANTVALFAQSGGRAFYACRVGNDALGQFYADDLDANHIDHPLTPDRRADQITGQCLVLITPDGERTLCTCLGASEQFSRADLLTERIAQSKCLYVEGYLVSSPSALEAILEAMTLARQAGVPTAFTFSDVNILSAFRPQIDRVMDSGVDVLFCNHGELLGYTGLSEIGQATQAVFDRYATSTLCVTLGAQGARVCTRAHDSTSAVCAVLAPVTPQVNANGAGDAFAGAFLYHTLVRKQPPDVAGTLACAAASRVVSQAGARLTREQVRALPNTL